MWIMEAKRHIEPHKAVFILVGTKVSIAYVSACICIQEFSSSHAYNMCSSIPMMKSALGDTRSELFLYVKRRLAKDHKMFGKKN